MGKDFETESEVADLGRDKGNRSSQIPGFARKGGGCLTPAKIFLKRFAGQFTDLQSDHVYFPPKVSPYPPEQIIQPY